MAVRQLGILRNVWRWFREDWRALGPSWALFFLRELISARFARSSSSSQPIRTISIQGYPHPIHYRAASSDARVIRNVLLHEEYRACSSLPDVKLIIDGGANIGLSAIYFLERFPDAQLIVVEPDAANLALCRCNLEPYGQRVRCYHAAIWSGPVSLKIDRTHANAKLDDWALRVSPITEGESPDVEGIDIPTLLRESRQDRIGLLKVDIEGAEVEMLRSSASAWLSRTDNMVIELHGLLAVNAFESALKTCTFQRLETGEYIFCRSIRCPSS